MANVNNQDPLNQIREALIRDIRRNAPICTEILISLLLKQGAPEIILEMALYLASHIRSTENASDLISNDELAIVTTQSNERLSALTIAGMTPTDNAASNIPTSEQVTPQQAENARKQGLTGAALSEYEKCINHRTKPTASVWGPAMAMIILRLEKRQVGFTVSKLQSLHTNISRLYPKIAVNCPRFEERALWENALNPLQY